MVTVPADNKYFFDGLFIRLLQRVVAMGALCLVGSLLLGDAVVNVELNEALCFLCEHE